MLWRIASGSTMNDVVLDANVIVGMPDDQDVHHARAIAMLERIREAGARPLLLDMLVAEAVSVLCRRARQRNTRPPDLDAAIGVLRASVGREELQWVGGALEEAFLDVLDVVADTGGVLNFNDALLVVLQRSGRIDEVASFDQVTDFRRLA